MEYLLLDEMSAREVSLQDHSQPNHLLPIVTNTMPTSSEIIEGRVIRSTGSWYDVETGDSIIPSRIRGKFRLVDQVETNPLAVGDYVSLRMNNDGTGLVVDRKERRNRLTRKAAGKKVGIENVLVANVDAAWVMQSPRMPRLNPGFVDRVFIMAEHHEIDAGVILNKMDLCRKKDQRHVDEFTQVYTSLGYPVLPVSALDGSGIDPLMAMLKDKTSVIMGPSGVGKTTLLNFLVPALDLATNEVSDRTSKGKHTTTYAALYPLPGGGHLVDTPGIREYGLMDVTSDSLDYYFIEFRPLVKDCHFPSCTHEHEPRCAIRDAVEAGTIYPQRYQGYLNILFSLQEAERLSGW